MQSAIALIKAHVYLRGENRETGGPLGSRHHPTEPGERRGVRWRHQDKMEFEVFVCVPWRKRFSVTFLFSTAISNSCLDCYQEVFIIRQDVLALFQICFVLSSGHRAGKPFLNVVDMLVTNSKEFPVIVYLFCTLNSRNDS